MTSIREKQTDYGDRTAQNESNFEYIRIDKQNYLSPIENIFGATCSAGVYSFVVGYELYFFPFQRFKI